VCSSDLYNGDGRVEAGDYVIWRNNTGQATLTNRGSGITGPVGQADYDFWRSQFGNSMPLVGDGGAVWFDNASLIQLTATGAGVTTGAVPEPASWSLMMVIGLLGLWSRRR